MRQAQSIPYGAFAAVLAILLALPFFAPAYVVHVANFVFISSCRLLDWVSSPDLLAACPGAGSTVRRRGYVTALLTTKLGGRRWQRSFFGPRVCLWGATWRPAVRLIGLYSSCNSGIQQIVWIVLLNAVDLTGGPQACVDSRNRHRQVCSGHAGRILFPYLAMARLPMSWQTHYCQRLGMRLRALSDDELAASAWRSR